MQNRKVDERYTATSYKDWIKLYRHRCIACILFCALSHVSYKPPITQVFNIGEAKDWRKLASIVSVNQIEVRESVGIPELHFILNSFYTCV